MKDLRCAVLGRHIDLRAFELRRAVEVEPNGGAEVEYFYTYVSAGAPSDAFESCVAKL